jgi:hypothetical protein
MADQSRQAHPNAERGETVRMRQWRSSWLVASLTRVVLVFRTLQVLRIKPANNTNVVKALGAGHGMRLVARG